MGNCIIYFIRHASPDWSRNDLSYYIPPGPPLSGQGEKEAIELGIYLKGIGIQQLLVSPLVRCQKTAAIASEISGTVCQTEDLIREWQQDENMQDVRNRMLKILTSVQQRNKNHNKVGLVMHGGPIAVGLGILGMDEGEISKNRIYDHNNPLPPAGVWRAKRNGNDHKWEFELVFSPRHEVD